MTFARLSDSYVRREGPPRPRSPYQVIQVTSAGLSTGFQGGGDLSFGEPEGGGFPDLTDLTTVAEPTYDPYSYLDPWESPESEALNPNIWDDTQNVWYDPLTGNTFDPFGDQTWHSPEGMVYENGVWNWPTQYAEPAGPVAAGYFPENPSPQMFTAPIGPTTEGTVYNPWLDAWVQPEPSWWEQRISALVEASERLGGLAETSARALTAPAIAPYELARGVSQQLGGPNLPDINPLERGLEAAGIPITPGNVAREAGQALVPTTPAEIALTVPFAVAGTAAGLRAGEEPLRAALRGALEAFAWDPTQPGSALRLVEDLQPTVVRVAAQPEALRPLEGGLVASRGGMEVIDPAGVRVLGIGDVLGPGEREYFHGTVNGLIGDIQPGLNVTPLVEDAQRFADITARSIRAGLQEAPNVAPAAIGERSTGQMLREAAFGRLGETGGGVLPGVGGLGDLSRYNTAELRQIASERGIDLMGAGSKSAIIDRLTEAGRAAPSPEQINEAIKDVQRGILRDEPLAGEYRGYIQRSIQERLGSDPEVTLYRGTSPTRTALEKGPRVDEGPGRWWSTDLERARGYAGPNGQVWELKVRASELADIQQANPHAGRADEWQLGNPLQSRAQPFSETPTPSGMRGNWDDALRGAAPEDVTRIQQSIDDTVARSMQRETLESTPREIPSIAETRLPELQLRPEQEAAMRFLDEGSVSIWPELRREFGPTQWDAWATWRGNLAGPEAAARGKDWTDLIDIARAAPDQETRVAIENVGLERLRAEMGKAQIDNLMRDAAALKPDDIRERLQLIDENLTRLAIAQQRMAEQAWSRMPGGYPGRGTGTAAEAGPRWSRQAADYWMGGARQGANTPERLRAIAGAGQSGVRESTISMLADAANVPRALMAGADFSPLFTHMAPLVAAHPELVVPIREAAGVMFDARKFGDLMTQYNVGSKWAQYNVKLNLPSISGPTREGSFIPSRFVAEKLLVYRETARFTTASLAGVRSNELDRFITKLEGMSKFSDAGRLNERGLSEAKKYARAVESITGRGNLGGAQFLDRYLSGIFFSPSYTLSQVQRYGPLLNVPFTPAWNESARNLGAYVATGASLMAAAAYAGMNVDFSPGSNFGKITDPTGHHINIWGGQQALARLIYQEATGKSVSEAGSVYPADRGALALAYGVNRLSPQASVLLRSVPQSVRDKIGDPDLQRALWPSGRADIVGSLYRFATNPSKATRDKALGAMGEFLTPLWVQDAVAGYRMDGLKGALVAGGLNIIGAQDIPYAPSTFTQQARGYEQVKGEIPFPEAWGGLARDDKWAGLPSREKELVKEARPEIFEQLQRQGTEEARKRGDDFQKALDEQASIRQVYRPVEDEIQRRLNTGQLDPYTARKALEANKDLMNAELRAVKFPEESSREKSQIQTLITAYNSIYDRTQRPDGSVDWEGRAQLQQAMLADVAQRYGQAWADRLLFNVEPRSRADASPLQQLNDAAKPLVGQYNSIPLGPEGSPNRYDARNAWLIENPLENANLFYLGRVTELKTPEAVQYMEQISPGVRPVVDFYLGFEPKGNVPRDERDRAANQYFNLPGTVDRQEWRREHPEVDATLWRSGYLPNVVSLEAWRLIGSPR